MPGIVSGEFGIVVQRQVEGVDEKTHVITVCLWAKVGEDTTRLSRNQALEDLVRQGILLPYVCLGGFAAGFDTGVVSNIFVMKLRISPRLLAVIIAKRKACWSSLSGIFPLGFSSCAVTVKAF